jgi:hypothetical protein
MPYIAGAAGAAFFAARRFAGFFAFRAAGLRVAFFATFRFAVFRAGFFAAALRAGFLAAALRTVIRFPAAFFRAGFLFAVIGIETTPSRVRSARHAPPKNAANMGMLLWRRNTDGFAPIRESSVKLKKHRFYCSFLYCPWTDKNSR